VNHPKKSLGQNFLYDQNIARKIVRMLELSPNDEVIEIGPGKGALTGQLLQMLPRLTAIELDDDLAIELQQRYNGKIDLIHQDVLTTDLRSLAARASIKVRIVGNIPYNITSPILFWILDACDVVLDSTLMIQREVADRLIAKTRTKEYGILSVFAQYYATPRIQFPVSRNSFYPIPKVSSSVVTLDFTQPFRHRVVHDRTFRAVVRTVFGQRRKTLKNGLRQFSLSDDLLNRLDCDLQRRPEELTVAEFVDLADQIIKLHGPLTFNSNH
jgi:16S rRNA (adenine1518-N6/adenine1519-N6)-dimethyltransferase